MSQVQPDSSGLSSDGPPGTSPAMASIEALPDTFVGLVPTLQEILGWSYNAVLTGVSFRIYRGVWSAVIKADFGNTAKVAFLDVGSFARCVEVTCTFAEKHMLEFIHDKYPPKERRMSPTSP